MFVNKNISYLEIYTDINNLTNKEYSIKLYNSYNNEPNIYRIFINYEIDLDIHI